MDSNDDSPMRTGTTNKTTTVVTGVLLAAISLQQAVDTLVAFMKTLTDKRYEHLLEDAK